MTHRIVLPMPNAYASPLQLGNNNEYSVFQHVNDQISTHPTIKKYITDLTDFLTMYRVLQYHPENFFTFNLGADASTALPLLDARHATGEPIAEADLRRCRELLTTFESALPLDPEDSMRELAKLVREGPQPTAPALLRDFFDATSTQLKCCRQRRTECDYPSLTFQATPPPRHVPATTTAPTQEHAPQPLSSYALADDKSHDDLVMAMMVEHNMCKKKQHEVGVMRKCLHNLIVTTQHNKNNNSKQVANSTILNIGEGKGYCSRVLALCDGIQVVGLDCNPDHKEGSSERVERVVDGRVGGVNFMYRPRGHLASITCRVGEAMDWRSILKGHVATRDDSTGMVTPLAAAGTALAVEQPAPLEKTQCLVCGHIMRRHGSAIVLKHIKEHMRKAQQTNTILLQRVGPDAGKPLNMQVDAYTALLESVPQQEAIATVLAMCYTDDVVIHTGGVVDAATDGKHNHKRLRDDQLLAGDSLALPRATRFKAWVYVQLEWISRCAPEAPAVSTMEKHVVGLAVTVLGFDEGTGRHRVNIEASSLDGLMSKRRDGSFVANAKNVSSAIMCSVIRAPWGQAASPTDEDTQTKAESFYLTEPWAAFALARPNAQRHALTLPTSTGVYPYILLRCIEPMMAPLAPPIHVPSLSNVVMMGLHTCGDLGSNICRLFTETRAPSMLLVSCCWHALTPNGFPLSNTIKSVGYTTDSVSLMLATQPLDMWSSESSEGHRGSARLLFFRSMLMLLWRKLEDAHRDAKPQLLCTCRFAPQPHLEPTFLRRMAKVKDSISFPDFAAEVVRSYILHPPASYNPRACESCIQWWAALVDNHLHPTLMYTAALALEEEHMTSGFRKFLGLTVLRMWMSHLLEALFLFDRALYVHDTLSSTPDLRGSDVTLAPLFDGALSPRMYGIFARRF